MDNEQDAWYRHAFADDYARIYQHRDHAEASRAIAALLAMVDPPPQAVCLDVCCGFGRHLAALNRTGAFGMGVDLSREMLSAACRQPEVAGRVTRGDMRALPFRSARCDVVFSFFTSFGYFADDAENQRVISEYARVLRPGGDFLIDFLNAHQVRETLVPEDTQTYPDFSLHQRRWIDDGQRTVEKEMVMTDSKGSRTYHERVKLYELADFQAFCAAAGLVIERTVGDYDGGAFTPASPRLIMIGQRAAS